MVDEDKVNPSWRAFLIHLNLAIKEHRDEASGDHRQQNATGVQESAPRRLSGIFSGLLMVLINEDFYWPSLQKTQFCPRVRGKL